MMLPNFSNMLLYLGMQMLRIRDFFPGSRIPLFSILDPNFLHPGSASKNLSSLTQKCF
jgi:hypothetical protein